MFKSVSLLPPLLLVFTLCSTSCMGTGGERVDDALLSEVSADRMAQVQQTRVNRDQAVDALAKAARDTAWGNDQADLARAELKSISQLLEEANLAALLAERNGTTAELEAAKGRHAQVTAMADATRAKLALRKRQLEHLKLQQKVALEQRRLADAEVEFTKAQAVQELDRVAAKKVPVREFEKQVRFLRTEVALAEVRASAAEDRVKDAQAEYDAAEALAAGLSSK